MCSGPWARVSATGQSFWGSSFRETTTTLPRVSGLKRKRRDAAGPCRPPIPEVTWAVLCALCQVCSDCAFLDSLLVSLASIHHRAKVMATIIYTSPVSSFWRHPKIILQTLNQSQGHLLSKTHTPNQYFLCPKSPRATYQTTRGSPWAQSLPDIHTSNPQ